jgi:hypothetical protein
MLKRPRQYLFLWIVPLVWLLIAGLGWIYRGGENIAFGIALMPGILVAFVIKAFGNSSFSNDDFIWITPVGLIPMFLVGLLLDYAQVRLKIFVVSFCAGIVVAYILIAISFSSEARRLGSISAAAHKFDFDQRDRAIAWQVLCTALGLYISIPGSLLWTLGARAIGRPRVQIGDSGQP